MGLGDVFYFILQLGNMNQEIMSKQLLKRKNFLKNQEVESSRSKSLAINNESVFSSKVWLSILKQ